jgi:hypothetical protein
MTGVIGKILNNLGNILPEPNIPAFQHSIVPNAGV